MGKKYFYCMAGVSCWNKDNNTKRMNEEIAQTLKGKHLCKYCYDEGFRLIMGVVAKRIKKG
jgi:hypothetical protein